MCMLSLTAFKSNNRESVITKVQGSSVSVNFNCLTKSICDRLQPLQLNTTALPTVGSAQLNKLNSAELCESTGEIPRIKFDFYLSSWLLGRSVLCFGKINWQFYNKRDNYGMQFS